MKCTRLRLLSTSFLISTLAVGFVPALEGQATTPGTQLQRYGSVDVRQLPPPGHHNGTLKQHGFFVQDPQAFKAKKTAAESGVVSHPGSAPVTSSASSISAGPGPGFAGVSFGETIIGAVPPDTQVAAGAGFVVEAVNINIRVWNMNVSPPTVTNFDLIDFFGVGLSDLISDPRIRFDPVQQRWYLSCVTIEQTFVNPPQGDFRLGVSTSSDPTQPFTLYAATTGGAFPDYPHLGFNEDKLVLTGNSFGLPLSANSPFLGTEFLVVNKSDLMNPNTGNPRTRFFGAPQGLDSIEPAESLSSTCNGANCTLFMAAVPDASLPQPANILRIWSLQGTPGVGSGVSFVTTDLSIPPVSIPPGAIQQGSTNLIETNDARLLDAIYRDGSLWASSNTGCTPAGDTMTRACMHFSQVNTAAMTLAQDFVFGTPGTYYYYPAIQVDPNDNLVAVFNQSSSTEYPSIYVAGQPAGAPGSFTTPLSLLEGQFPLTPSSADANRWGDYSGAALDGNTIWVAGEYVHSANSDDWGTWIAPVQFNGGTLTSTATTVSALPNPSTLGQLVTFTATVTSGGGTPTGTVTFKDGSNTLGTGTLSAGQATFGTSSLSVGSHSITAVYGGDASFAGSTSATLSQTVNQAGTTTTVSSNANPSTFGQAVTFTATVTSGGGTPTGTVTFKDGSSTLGTGTLSSGQTTFATSILGVGPHSITAVYGGDTSFAGSTSASLSQTVNQAGTTTAVSSNVNPSALGQSVTFTATVTSGGGTPTGTVTFKDGSSTLGTGTLSAGQATFATSSLSAGPHSITAVYGGTASFAGSTSTALTQNVNQAASTTTKLTSSSNPSVSGQLVTFTATVISGSGTPAGSVAFKDGSNTLASGTLNGSGQATFSTSSLSVGTHSITAVYAGNASFLGSTSTALKQAVKKH